MTRYVVYLCVAVVLLTALYGYVIPLLLSADNDLAPVGGFVLLALSLLAVFAGLRRVFKHGWPS